MLKGVKKVSQNNDTFLKVSQNNDTFVCESIAKTIDIAK